MSKGLEIFRINSLSKISTDKGHGLQRALALRLSVAEQGPPSAAPNDEEAKAAQEAAEQMVAEGVLKLGSSGGYAGYWCHSCSVHCTSASAWKQHCQSLKHRGELLGNPWCHSTTRWLKQFPRRHGGTLEVSSKYFDLEEHQKLLLLDCQQLIVAFEK